MVNGYSSRKASHLKESVTFLIICEGQKTERIYFNRYRERNSGVMIVTPNSTVTDPEGLVDLAIRQMKYRYDIDFENGDQVWCVFDADRNSDENIEKARKKAAKNKINLCISIPCFELWYLLHFVYFDQIITTAELQEKLAEHIPGYDKTKDCFDLLMEKRGTAIKYANQLNKKQIQNNISLPSKSNPSTQVVNLVQQILEIKEKNKRFRLS